jgi:hypothetical protein
MMTLQEIIQSLDDLPMQDQTSLLNVLNLRLATIAVAEPIQSIQSDGDSFWEGVLRFRETIEREGIEFVDEDFADLRDRSPGREIDL